MRRRLLTLGDESNYRFQRHRLAREARESGWFDRVDALTQDDIAGFLDERRDFVDQNPSGMGLWAWKPHIILSALSEMEDGDMLVYLDAGSFLLPHRADRLEEYSEMLASAILPVMVFSIHTPEVALQKRSALRALGLEDDLGFLGSGQVEGGALVAIAGPASRGFAAEWLRLCTRDNHSLLTNQDDLPQLDGFMEHRNDQSLLSALAKLRGAVILPFECYGAGPFFMGRHSDAGPKPRSADTFRREPTYDHTRHPTWVSYLEDPLVRDLTMGRVRDGLAGIAAGMPADDPDFDLQAAFMAQATAMMERIQHVGGLWKVAVRVLEPSPDTADSRRQVHGEALIWMRPGDPTSTWFALEGGKIYFSECQLFVRYLYKKEWSRQHDAS